MKRLLLALALAFVAIPARAEPPNAYSAPTTQHTNGTSPGLVITSIFAAGAAWTYITFWGGDPTIGSVVRWYAGTGASCGTSTITLTPSLTFTTSAPFIYGDGNAPIMVAPAGLGVCIITATQSTPSWFGWAQY